MANTSTRTTKIKWFFLFVSIIVLYIYWQIIAPFALVLITAGVTAIIIAPVDRRLTGLVKSRRLSAVIILLGVLLLIIGPLFGLAVLMVQQATEVVNMSLAQDGWLMSMNAMFEHYLAYAPVMIQEDIRSIDLVAIGTGIAGWVAEHIGAILSGTANLVFQTVIFFMALYYFMIDREQIYQFALDVSPFKDTLDKKIIERISKTVRGVVFGKIVVALIQAVVAVIGMTIFGVPGALLWGALIVLAAQVPMLGTGLVMVPAVAFLFFTGNVWAALGLLIWAVVAVSTIDNIVSPFIVGAKIHMNQLLILISILGGLQLFGPIGFIIGPTVLAAVMVIVELYKNGCLEE
ncbi:MAG: AI-2E family transporter [Patescibacteria group bacterium]|nr:AI-2E family transporter [Patescibacteria group bacterium]